jgi:hypothetical protein
MSNIEAALGTAIAALETLSECSGDKFGMVGTASFHLLRARRC